MDLSRNAWFVRNLSGLYLFVLHAHVSLRMLIYLLICHIEAWVSPLLRSTCLLYFLGGSLASMCAYVPRACLVP